MGKKINLDIEKIKTQYLEGLTSYEIAEQYHCRPSTIQYYLKKNGVKLRSNSVNIDGKKFGKLTVLRQVSKCQYLCQCDCKNTKVCYKKRLLDGRNTSCGCTTNKRGCENGKWTGYEEITGSYWASITWGAKARNIPIDITIQQAWELFISQQRRCALTGILMILPAFQYTKNDNIKNVASLDRIDSSQGYVVGNCQWVLREINMMKMDLGQLRFIELCKAVGTYV